jgi:hypothetical protein
MKLPNLISFGIGNPGIVDGRESRHPRQTSAPVHNQGAGAVGLLNAVFSAGCAVGYASTA